jgi:hypothetical protein
MANLQRRLLAAAVFLPVACLLLLPGGGTVNVCRFGGMSARAASCCPGHHQPEPAPQSRIEAQPCCSMHAVDAARVALALPGRGEPVAAALALPVMDPAGLAPHPVFPDHRFARRDANGVGPPLRLVKQSFLI